MHTTNIIFYRSAAYEKSAIVSTTPMYLLSVLAENTGNAARWLHLFDAVSIPANGTSPFASVMMPSVSQDSLDFSAFDGYKCKLGLVIACSTTGPTLTLTSSNDLLVSVFGA